MYTVLDIPKMMKIPSHTRNRRRPVNGFKSTILLRGGKKIDIVPPQSEIRRVGDLWEIHMQLTNKRIVESIAKELGAIAWLVDE